MVPAPPPALRLSVEVELAPEIIPLIINVPPVAWLNAWVDPAAAPKTMGASIVLVPLVFCAEMADVLDVVVVTLSVSFIEVVELVKS